MQSWVSRSNKIKERSRQIGLIMLLLLMLIHLHGVQMLDAAPVIQGGCPPPPAGSSQPPVPGTNPDRYYDMRSAFTDAGRNALGSAGPTYDSINRGNPPVPDTVSASRAIPHILLRGMAWQESLWQHFDPNTGCTKTSADGGYGLMQITTCMKTGDNCSGISQSRVAGEWKYNLGTGTKLLIQKWNTVAPFVGDNDHTAAEQWYFAVLAYNGWSSANDPNSNAFNPSRPPFGEGNYRAFNYPYQERVSGWMAHPELAASRWLWQPTRIAAIPRGIFGLRGANDWRPPTTTPQPKFTVLNPIRVINGIGPSIVLQNMTNQTLAVDVAMYNSDHTFNTWWLDTTTDPQYAPYNRIPYIRVPANASPYPSGC